MSTTTREQKLKERLPYLRDEDRHPFVKALHALKDCGLHIYATGDIIECQNYKAIQLLIQHPEHHKARNFPLFGTTAPMSTLNDILSILSNKGAQFIRAKSIESHTKKGSVISQAEAMFNICGTQFHITYSPSIEADVQAIQIYRPEKSYGTN